MKKILILLLVAAAVVLGWYFLKPRAASADGDEAARPAAKVETVVLTDQPMAETVEAFGTVAAAPAGEQVLAVAYDCVVRQVQVGVGSTVAAGDTLLVVDPSPDARLAADSARSLLALATKAEAAMQERYDLKLATNQDLLAARQAAEDAKLKADSLTARGLAGDGRITAAAGGVVTRLEVMVGAVVPAGTALMTVSTKDHLEVRLGVEAADATLVAAGQPVTLESVQRAEAGKISTTIRSVGAALDPQTGAVEARVPVPAGAALFLGEHVRGEIQVRRKEHALVVPRRAVLPDDDQHIVFTVVAGKAVRHEVQLGLATDEWQEVIGGGLQARDVVVTLGNYELEPGMAVQAPEKSAGPPGKKEAAPGPDDKP